MTVAAIRTLSKTTKYRTFDFFSSVCFFDQFLTRSTHIHSGHDSSLCSPGPCSCRMFSIHCSRCQMTKLLPLQQTQHSHQAFPNSISQSSCCLVAGQRTHPQYSCLPDVSHLIHAPAPLRPHLQKRLNPVKMLQTK